MKTNAFVADGFRRWLETGAQKRRAELEAAVRAQFELQLAAASSPEERDRIEAQIKLETEQQWRKLKPGLHCLWTKNP